MYCSEWSLASCNGRTVTAVSLKCGAWTCDECRPERKARLVAQALSGNPNTFITLTVRPDARRPPDARARDLADAWRKIVARALTEAGRDLKKRPYPAGLPLWKRAYERTGRPTPRLVTLAEPRLPYLAVVEATKRGEPHLHILARVQWIDQRWLSEQARALLGAPVVDIRRCNSAGEAAAYVAKYVGKAPHRFATCKRYWCTRSWDQRGPPEEGCAGREREGWEVVKRPLSEIIDAARADRWNVMVVGDVMTATAWHDITKFPAWARPP